VFSVIVLSFFPAASPPAEVAGSPPPVPSDVIAFARSALFSVDAREHDIAQFVAAQRLPLKESLSNVANLPPTPLDDLMGLQVEPLQLQFPILPVM
jgi:hypothetical protein